MVAMEIFRCRGRSSVGWRGDGGTSVGWDLGVVGSRKRRRRRSGAVERTEEAGGWMTTAPPFVKQQGLLVGRSSKP
jgi:hypothetical protein